MSGEGELLAMCATFGGGKTALGPPRGGWTQGYGPEALLGERPKHMGGNIT